jgi:sodium-dependent dicarboxylate transporter 2/3/5
MEQIWRRLWPHRWVILLVCLLLLIDQYHLYQYLFDVSRAEEITLSILLLTALLWITETLPLYITSLGVLALSILWLLPALEGGASPDLFYQAFFGDITLLFMGGFVLSALMSKYGLARRMANWMLLRTGSAPDRVLLGLIIISAVLSMWISNTATAAMMFAIVAPLVAQLPGAPFAKAISISIPFACNIGGLGTPIGSPPNAIAMEYLMQEGLNITFSSWMLFSWPVVILLLYFLWQLLLRWYPPKELELELNVNAKAEPFTVRQKIVIVLFALTVLGWLTTGLTGLSTGMVGLLLLLACFGIGLLKTPDFKNISWDILFMLGGGLCLGVALKASGLTETIAAAIPTQIGFYLVLIILIVITALMTTFMSNTATANLLIPVAMSLSGYELFFAIAISMMCSTSMALPVSTPPNAIAFGSGLLRSKDLLYSGLVITLLAIVITLLLVIFYLPLIF